MVTKQKAKEASTRGAQGRGGLPTSIGFWVRGARAHGPCPRSPQAEKCRQGTKATRAACADLPSGSTQILNCIAGVLPAPTFPQSGGAPGWVVWLEELPPPNAPNRDRKANARTSSDSSCGEKCPCGRQMTGGNFALLPEVWMPKA